MNVGMGGADVSLGTIAASMSGLRDTLKIGGAKLASLAGHYEGVSTLNAVNMLGYSGDTDNFALGRAIWDDRIQVRYSKDVKAADGYYGAYNGTDTPNEIQLSSDLLGTGKELAAKLAAVMAHEGTHVAGNRYEAVAHQQGLQTYGALLETFGLQGDHEFALGMIAALMDPASYVANTGAMDNMMVKINGSIFDDNKDDQVSFEDGRPTIKTGKGKQGTLEAFLGIENAYATLLKAGYSWDKEKGRWSGGTGITREQIDEAYKQGLINKEKYKEITGSNGSQIDEQLIREEMAFLRNKRQDQQLLSEYFQPAQYLPENMVMGDGSNNNPFLFIGQGFVSQLDIAKMLNTKEVGPCFLTELLQPFVQMGFSAQQIVQAATKIPKDAYRANDGLVQDTTKIWSAMSEALGSPLSVRYLGGKKQDMSWDQFIASGATIGVLWVLNPNNPESEHWLYMFRANDQWYVADSWDKNGESALTGWDVDNWSQIKKYVIRPLEITVRRKSNEKNYSSLNNTNK
jgi:hypothetical protein